MVVIVVIIKLSYPYLILCTQLACPDELSQVILKLNSILMFVCSTECMHVDLFVFTHCKY